MANPARVVPRATYRLQLNKDFTFKDVAALAPYLGGLGISHAYLSPVLAARRGSTHGYDAVDHTRLNPELGTMDDFRDMAAGLGAQGVGIILDIVPNHMGIGGDQNLQWLDLLRWGRKSAFADWFDVNWQPSEPTLKDKVLVPFLGTSFGEALNNGTLSLRFDAEAGEFAVWIGHEHKLPVCPDTYPLLRDMDEDLKDFCFEPGQDLDAPTREKLERALGRLNKETGRHSLARLIEAQHWRVARYTVASDDINYRRFFIVSDLAAIRIEKDEVFAHVHSLVFELIAEGLVEGLRIDHIDGLFDPKAYCLALRERSPRPIYLVVEKILAPHEALRTDWNVDGTTGYEFASAVTQLLADPAGADALTSTYREFTGRKETLDDLEHRSKLDIIDFEMAAELDGLVSRLRALAARNRTTADLTRNALRNGLRYVIASLPVYRTYLDADGPADTDARNIGLAVARAREHAPAIDPVVFDFLQTVMTCDADGVLGAPADRAILDVARRIQQYSGPVMAKGLEDTALYRYNRLIALSDVGQKPDRVAGSIASFHDFNSARQKLFPQGMLTTSSHDTKRGEDVRARVTALSGSVETWSRSVVAWSAQLAAQGAPEIEANDRYYFFQLLLGAWPLGKAPTELPEREELEAFRARLDTTMLKSIREARVRTNWYFPKSGYEEKVGEFIRVALAPGRENAFLASFLAFENAIGEWGAQSGLIETVLKLTVPGVPDIYQGAEYWELSMVDPDNRRPVDFSLREETLGASRKLSYRDLAEEWRSGRIKQRAIAELLGLRKQEPALFSSGTYEPVDVDPLQEGRVCAFVRRTDQAALLVAVRLFPWRGTLWEPASLTLQGDGPSRGDWMDILGDGRNAGPLDTHRLFATLPVAVLLARD